MSAITIGRKLFYDNFHSFGEAIKYCTYLSVKTGTTYDVSDGKVTITVIGRKDQEIIFDSYNITQSYAPTSRPKNVNVEVNEKKAIFPAMHFPFIPKTNDLILDANSVYWKVVGGTDDAGGIHYELNVVKIVTPPNIVNA